ncbi:MAG: hypothetical protein IRY88_17885 [Rubrobacteraceae bacterium]|nr:hypothetical protein [Rubrobacteraceae bacterium]
MKVRAEAPGKLFLLGEYAVLEGAPALMLAVDARASAVVEPAATPGWELVAPDVLQKSVAFRFDEAGLPVWPEEDLARRLSLVDQVLRGLAVRGLLPGSEELRVTLDTSDFFAVRDGKRRKLGLGSSAALTVALSSALTAAAGREDRVGNRRGWLEELLHIHRALQDGRGSGADLAAAIYGGCLRYRLDEDNPLIEGCGWPEGLHRLFVWTGTPSSTGEYLARLDAWRQRNPGEYDRRLGELRALAEEGIDAVGRGGVEETLGAFAAYARALHELGAATKIPIYSTEHRRISGLVEGAGGVYKPCGAGGGDFGVALFDEVGRLEVARVKLERAGFLCPPLAPDGDGLRLEMIGEER